LETYPSLMVDPRRLSARDGAALLPPAAEPRPDPHAALAARAVATLPDHILLYGAREAFGRLGFLTASTGVRSLPDMHARTGGLFGNPDLRADLEQALRCYLDTAMDVVVVDQTTPEHFVPAMPAVPYGSMAERALIDPAHAMDLPEWLADAVAATLGNAGWAAWLPLSWRASLRPGERVLILGATGVVGRLAVQAAGR
jgi:hypothetical protein